jgi:hypothetical protein
MMLAAGNQPDRRGQALSLQVPRSTHQLLRFATLSLLFAPHRGKIALC